MIDCFYRCEICSGAAIDRCDECGRDVCRSCLIHFEVVGIVMCLCVGCLDTLAKVSAGPGVGSPAVG